jgi:hypothetical protein
MANVSSSSSAVRGQKLKGEYMGRELKDNGYYRMLLQQLISPPNDLNFTMSNDLPPPDTCKEFQ